MNDTTKLVSNPIVTASKISVEDFVHKVEVPGTVETDENALITAEASGTIEVVHVKQGQKVSKGQVLVTIDSEILASNIDEVETALELATYMFEKQKKLQEQGVGVEIEYEQAKNQQRSLEQKLKTMRAQKGKTVVRAPFSGVVDDIMVNQGEIAAPQIPLLRIVNNRTIRVNASLSENLLSKVNQGTPVEMVFPSFNDTTITSVVTTRGNYIDPTNRTFKIQIEIKNNELLLPNQFTKVNVTDFSRKDALVIDSNAILQDTENNSYVFKLTKDGEVYNVTKTYVNVVKTFKGKSCIEGEVSDGDLIVVKGAKGITEADKVQIQ
jgi:RND family efflux transporter MFP subunit